MVLLVACQYNIYKFVRLKINGEGREVVIDTSWRLICTLYCSYVDLYNYESFIVDTKYNFLNLLTMVYRNCRNKARMQTVACINLDHGSSQ